MTTGKTKKEYLKVISDTRQDAKDLMAEMESNQITPKDGFKFKIVATYKIVEIEKGEPSQSEWSSKLIARYPQPAGSSREDAKAVMAKMKEKDQNRNFYIGDPNKKEKENGVEFTIKEFEKVHISVKAQDDLAKEQEKLRKAQEAAEKAAERAAKAEERARQQAEKVASNENNE